MSSIPRYKTRKANVKDFFYFQPEFTKNIPMTSQASTKVTECFDHQPEFTVNTPMLNNSRKKKIRSRSRSRSEQKILKLEKFKKSTNKKICSHKARVKIGTNKKPFFWEDDEREKTEKEMERTVVCEKQLSSGQSELKFEYYVSKSMKVARKKFHLKKYYQRELKNYKILDKKLPHLVAKLISSDDVNWILESEKGFCDLKDFLVFYINKKITNVSQVERLIIQLTYGIINIIKSFNLNGILHGDIKPGNIILNYKPVVGEDSLILKMIDLGMSINFHYATTEDSDYMKSCGYTEAYTNKSLLERETKGANLAAEFWCLGNIILEIIEIFTKIKGLKCQNFKRFKEDIRPKIVKKISKEIIDLLDILFSEEVLSKIDNHLDFLKNQLDKIKDLNLYDAENGYLINIPNLNEFIDEIYELNPLLQNLSESTVEDAYKKAFLYTKVKPNSQKNVNEDKMIFLKCLTMKDISEKHISKCLFHLGNFFHQSMRKYQLCSTILRNYDTFSQMFPKDFRLSRTKCSLQNFVKIIENNGTIELLKNLAFAALKIQNQILPKESVIKARYFDLVSLSWEYGRNYKEAFFFQKKHVSIWRNSAKKINLQFIGDMDYSKGQLLKYASFLQLKGKYRIYINKLFNMMNLNDEPENAWTKHAKVYHSIFLLKNGNEKEMLNEYNKAKELFKKLISGIEKKTFVNHSDLNDIVELLERILHYEDKFGIINEFSIKNNIRKNPLFSSLTFEMNEQTFLEECRRVYNEIKDRLDTFLEKKE